MWSNDGNEDQTQILNLSLEDDRKVVMVSFGNVRQYLLIYRFYFSWMKWTNLRKLRIYDISTNTNALYKLCLRCIKSADIVSSLPHFHFKKYRSISFHFYILCVCSFLFALLSIFIFRTHYFPLFSNIFIFPCVQRYFSYNFVLLFLFFTESYVI